MRSVAKLSFDMLLFDMPLFNAAAGALNWMRKIPGDRMAVDVATATAEDFEPRLNDAFALRTPAGEVELRLAAVHRLGQALRKGGAFSLMFAAQSNLGLAQAIYSVSHPVLGTLELFVVPIGPVPQGFGYEAVFT